MMCDNKDDVEFEADLISEFGEKGFYQWICLLRIIGKYMNYQGEQDANKCDLEMTWKDWQAKLGGKKFKLLQFFLYLENKGKIKLFQNDFKIKIKCPILLNLRDNHQKRSVANSNKNNNIYKDLKTIDRPLVDPVSNKLKLKQFADKSLLDQKRFLKKMENIGDQNKLTADDQKQAFDLGWSSYPVKIGKEAAWRHFRKTVTTKGDYNRVIDAFNYYQEYVNWRVSKGQNLAWQHGYRWFAEWEDWAVKAETDPNTWELKRYKL